MKVAGEDHVQNWLKEVNMKSEIHRDHRDCWLDELRNELAAPFVFLTLSFLKKIASDQNIRGRYSACLQLKPHISGKQLLQHQRETIATNTMLAAKTMISCRPNNATLLPSRQ